MENVVRAFIAVELSPILQDKLRHLSGELRQKLSDVPIRWIAVENIHLTLKFLGDVSVSNLDLLYKILQVEAAERSSFEISVGGMGAFPNSHRPRVVWVGVEAPAELNILHHNIEKETARLGYTSEKHRFSPHLTLGRVARNATPAHIAALREVLQKSKVGFLGVTSVDAVHLFKSDLRPGGAVYTCLFSAPLGKLERYL
ncbi:MAG: RNA 2',3'-cyclic phosphodiesterase [Chloroflexota bacterium]